MPITLRVHTYRNAPPAAPLAHRFDRLGGSLGRSPTNDLALDDPGKYISRSHARIEFRDGGYALVDIGSNPSVVNDRPVGIGHAVILADGDRITLGDYQLVVSVEPEAAPAPLPSPLTPAPHLLRPDRPAQAPSAAPGMTIDPDDSLASAGILDVGNAPLGAGFDPLGLNLFGGPAPAPAMSATPAPAWRGAESDHVPPEQLPFAAASPMAFAPPPGFTPPPSQPHVPPQTALAHVPPPAGAAGMGIPDDYDPLADFLPPRVQAAVPPAVPSAMPPTVPSAFAPILAPPAAKPAPAQVAERASMPAPVIAPAMPLPPATPVESSEATMLVPSSAPAPDAPSFAPRDPAPPAVPLPPSYADPVPATPAPAAPAPAPAPAPARVTGSSAEADPVIQALMRGLGLSELNTKRTPEDIAELAGAMLREATAGTMGVLMARAMTKRESRLDMTMIGAQANNPLKFFPDAHSALTQMVNGTMPGYMAPVRAFAGAFDDLKAHELAIMAGMRAALAGVLERFDPAAIEARLQVPTVMDKVLASNRKAKMWDRMVELYTQLAGEADSDFHRLFGEAFGNAYEEQVERLRQSRL